MMWVFTSLVIFWSDRETVRNRSITPHYMRFWTITVEKYISRAIGSFSDYISRVHLVWNSDTKWSKMIGHACRHTLPTILFKTAQLSQATLKHTFTIASFEMISKPAEKCNLSERVRNHNIERGWCMIRRTPFFLILERKTWKLNILDDTIRFSAKIYTKNIFFLMFFCRF